ncbi:uncharacterized protein LOC141909023 [Tubulanus polymorphus]|uniref:uncharacterized protein LOC141909023 n=1 Tax=Tubulanus polymorphus TaxID=672921 RepID=UPI003DA64116
MATIRYVFMFVFVGLISESVIRAHPLHKRSTDCPPRDVVPQREINTESLMGTWYVISRTHGLWRGLTWDASVSNLAMRRDGSIQVSYSFIRKGKCLGPLSLHLNPVGDAPGHMTVVMRGTPTRGDLKIVYADFDCIITYECYSSISAGVCARGGELVVLMCRDKTIDATKMNEMKAKMTGDYCVNPTELVDIPHDRSCLSVINSKRKKRTPKELAQFSPPIIGSDGKPCGPVCYMYCPYGNRLDERGCAICECNWPGIARQTNGNYLTVYNRNA